MASASIKEIKNRIRSIESTRQITRAMELVASSKLKKAQMRIEASRPYFRIIDGIRPACNIARTQCVAVEFRIRRCEKQIADEGQFFTWLDADVHLATGCAEPDLVQTRDKVLLEMLVPN